MKRIFVAVKVTPSPRFVNLYSELLRELNNERIKWVDILNLHITLAFVGETEDSVAGEAGKILERICTLYKPFKIGLKGIGMFGGRSNPRVIWVGIDNSIELEGISEGVRSAYSEAGIITDTTVFRPHITMGRIKFLKATDKLHRLVEKYHQYNIQESNVNEVILFESILKPSGPLYNPLKTVLLLG